MPGSGGQEWPSKIATNIEWEGREGMQVSLFLCLIFSKIEKFWNGFLKDPENLLWKIGLSLKGDYMDKFIS